MNSKLMSSEQIKARAKYLAHYPPNMFTEYEGRLFVNDPVSLQYLPKVKNMIVRATDIWLCGYMKSGNTWLSEIVSLIMADGVVDRVNDRPISERVPNIYTPVSKDLKPNYLQQLTGPRITLNHLEVKFLPRFEQKTGKMIYIMRNPKDVCVSFYHYQQLFSDFTCGPTVQLDEYCQYFLEGYLDGDWLSHVTDFWLTYGQNYPNVLFVAYEELMADLPAMVRTIARFLGKQFTDETVDTIVAHSSAESMRDNPMANRTELLAMFGVNAGSRFVRKAVVGDWRSLMTDEQSTRFDERYAQRLAAIGLRVCDDMVDAQRCMRDTGRVIEQRV